MTRDTWLPPDPSTRFSPPWCWRQGHPPVTADCRACHEAAVAAWNRRWAKIRSGAS